MQAAQKITTLSVPDYLEGERISEVKHELMEGYVYAMTGASKNHERLSGNVYTEFSKHLEKSPCEPFGSNTKVRVGDNFFYPDAMVVCDDQSDNDYYTESPVIIVEVLSKSTRRKDQTNKREHYLQIPTLQEYILIEQDSIDIEIFRRNDNWRSQHYYSGDQITLDSIGLTLSVETLYRRVQYINK